MVYLFGENNEDKVLRLDLASQAYEEYNKIRVDTNAIITSLGDNTIPSGARTPISLKLHLRS